jgi:hypothetical protein
MREIRYALCNRNETISFLTVFGLGASDIVSLP